jgi:hypothetical protein
MYEQFHEWLLMLTPDQLIQLGGMLVFLCGFIIGRLSKRNVSYAQARESYGEWQRQTLAEHKRELEDAQRNFEKRAIAAGVATYYTVDSTDDCDAIDGFDGDPDDIAEGDIIFVWNTDDEAPQAS